MAQHTRRRIVTRLAATAVGGAALFVAASVVPYTRDSSIHLAFNPKKPFPDRVASGFYRPELTPGHVAFAWTNGRAVIALPEIDRRAGWRLGIRMARGAWSPGGEPPAVTIQIDDAPQQIALLSDDFHDTELEIPRRPGRRGIRIGLNSAVFTPGGRDPRQLGIVVSGVSLEPLASVRPSASWLLFACVSGVAINAAGIAMGLDVAALGCLAMIFGLAYGWLFRTGSNEYLLHGVAPPLVALAAVLVGVAAVASVRLDRLSQLARPGKRIAAAATALTQPLVLLTAVHLTVLALRLPLLTPLPEWFFPTLAKSAGPWYLMIALAVAPFAGWLGGRRSLARPMYGLAWLLVVGVALQHGYAWSEGRGLDGMRSRIVDTGHAEFATVAVREPSMWGVLTAYDAKLAREELGSYAHSKPPGQLLFYMATERIARSFARDSSAEARLDATRTLAAVTWPVFTYLALFPLFFSLRRLIGDEAAMLACTLYIVVPSVTLITLHTDQVLFPFLFMSTIWTAVQAQIRRSWLWAFAAGAVLFLSGFFTFALILAGLLAAGFAAQTEATEAGGDRWRSSMRSVGRTVSGIGAGFMFLLVLFAVGFNYDFLEGMLEATAFHKAWKGWGGGFHDGVYFAWLDYLEFAVWLGVPLVVLTLGGLRRSLLSAVAGTRDRLTWPGVALLAVFLYLGFFSHTKGETARLWLPLVPVCCALAANELRERYKGSREVMTAIVIALQVLTVWLTKIGQDFR
jgi:hypothetical protein